MKRLARLLVRLYPRAIRTRYGAEIADLLEHSRSPVRDTLDVLWSALLEYRPRWLLLVLFWAGAAGLWMSVPPLYATLPLALMITAVWAGMLMRRKGSWWHHPLAVLCWFGLLWLIPPTGARLAAYACWLAGGMGLAYLMHRGRIWPAAIGGVVLMQLLIMILTGPRHAFTALWMLSANYGVDAPFPVAATTALVILNPALALALTLARWRGEGEGEGAQRTARRTI